MESMDRCSISVKGLKKKFDQKEIFQNVSFQIAKGEFVALFGANGCGKTTILNILSQLVEKDSGECMVKNLAHAEFSYIFQNYRDSLLPWKTNYENIIFPLELQNKRKEEIAKAVEDIQSIVGRKIELDKYPYQLSGGEQQMVALARALVGKPKMIFVDEPSSALDYENNLLLRKVLQEYYTKHNPTILMITHDIEQAAHLASKIIVLSKSPTRVVDIIENQHQYPRPTSFLKSEHCREIKEKVLSAFEEGVNV